MYKLKNSLETTKFSLRMCSFPTIDMGESVKMDLCRFEWMNIYVFLSGFRG